MKELHNTIHRLMQQAQAADAHLALPQWENVVFPFSVENEQLAYLLSENIITYSDYQKIIQEYYERNKYLNLFEMAPRTFGETWGEEHIREMFPQFVKATKENLIHSYPSFDGEFDLYSEGIRIEVKACRANASGVSGSLASRAYLHQEALQNNFKYHYQQLKPSCCDVFIWIGVCRDKLLYWVLSSNDLLQSGKLGPQHRNENTGADDSKVFEGQVFMTEAELSDFAVLPEQIISSVYARGRRS